MVITPIGVETGAHLYHPLGKIESALAGLVVGSLGLYFLLDVMSRETQLPTSGTEIAMAMGLSLCVLVRLVHLVLKPAFNFVMPSFYLFVFVWMALAPLTQIVMGRGPLDYEFRLDAYRSGLLLVALGVVSYEIGAKLASRRVSYRLSSSTSFSVSVPALTWATLFGVPAVAAAIVYIGGPKMLFSSRFAFSAAVFGYGDSKATGALINAILLVVPFVLAFLWIIVLQGERELSLLQWVLLLLSNLINLMVNNPIAQSRFWVATVLLSMLGVFFARRWKSFGLVAIPASLFFLIVVFPFSDVFRYTGTNRQFKINDPVSQLAIKGDFDAFPQLAETIVRVQRHGIEWGHQLAGALGFFVPRTIWPGKPVDTGTLLGTGAGLGNKNLSAPLWAEGYIDFGITGVIVYLFALGYIMSRLSRMGGNSGLGPEVSIFIGVYQFVFLRGSLLQSMGVTIAILLMLRAVLRTTESTRKRTQPLQLIRDSKEES